MGLFRDKSDKNGKKEKGLKGTKGDEVCPKGTKRDQRRLRWNSDQKM